MTTESAIVLRNRIWSLSFLGLAFGILETRKLKESDPLGAAIKRASLFYSYRFLWPFFFLHPIMMLIAKRYVFLAMKMDNSTLLDHGQCDVIGTILLRLGFPYEAYHYLERGLTKNPPPHSKALLTIGLAEYYAEREKGKVSPEEDPSVLHAVLAALSLREQIEQEEDRVQALRQFQRVLLRATKLLLNRKTGHVSAKQIYAEAKLLANDPQIGTRGMRLKTRLLVVRLLHF